MFQRNTDLASNEKRIIEIQEQYIAELESKLAGKNEPPKPVKPPKPACKVSEKGCLTFTCANSLLRSFGATFYAQEWQVIFSNREFIEEEIRKQTAILSWK